MNVQLLLVVTIIIAAATVNVANAKCCYTGKGENYKGTNDKAKGGDACAIWASKGDTRYGSKRSKYHKYTEKNYCMNPSVLVDDGSKTNKPWCFLKKNNGWKYCDIPKCTDAADENPDCKETCYDGKYYKGIVPSLKCSKDERKELRSDTFELSLNFTSISNLTSIFGCHTGTGKKKMDYTGTYSLTTSGRTCQAWTEQKPFKHSYSKNAKNFPEGSVAAAKNFCRNPSNSGYLWCYTTDPNKRWEVCDIPKCEDK